MLIVNAGCGMIYFSCYHWRLLRSPFNFWDNDRPPLFLGILGWYRLVFIKLDMLPYISMVKSIWLNAWGKYLSLPFFTVFSEYNTIPYNLLYIYWLLIYLTLGAVEYSTLSFIGLSEDRRVAIGTQYSCSSLLLLF